jgi:hypothetical protein
LHAVRNKLHPGSKSIGSGESYHYDLNPRIDLYDRRLICRSVFGHEFGADYGPNNVHAIYSGDKDTNMIDIEITRSSIFQFKPGMLYRNANDLDTEHPEDVKVLITPRHASGGKGTRYDRVMIAPLFLNAKSVSYKEILGDGWI